MDSRATERQILEYENKLLPPTGEPIPLPLDFLRSITNDFCDEQELGRGGYGVVYKGILRRGSVIAVKKFNEIIRAGEDPSFENEASFLMGIKHQNVIQLLGYCAESKGVMMKQPNGTAFVAEQQSRMLCFEYMRNGGLDKHLSDESSGLEWNMRYKIIKGICSGLKYLHGRNIIHLDLKPQNILMDDTMMPKIVDFGLSRLLGEQKSHTVTKTANPPGTRGYMAPEYIDRGVISKKADIFSLGVIIIEILKGCKDDYPDYHQSTEVFQHFIEKVLSNWRNRFETSKYTAPELHTQLVKQCIDIALECLHPEKERRPNVSSIIEILDAAEGSYYVQNGEDLLVDHQERRPSSSTAEGRERGPRPDVVTLSIGCEIGYTNFIMELRRKLLSPQDPVMVDDILGENPGAYPVLRRQSARASRWLWVELRAVVGQDTFTTALAVRDDNVYCKGFRNQQGVWYELCGEQSIQNCPMLPSSGEWGNVEQLPGWGVSYSSILQVDNREQVENILSTGLGRAFAAMAVRKLARYPVLDGRDDYPTRSALAGLIVMVCEPARFNVVLDTFVGGWDSGTGLTRRLAGYMWEWKDMSHGLLQWRMDGYWPHAYRTTRQLVRSAGHALAHIHLVLNYNKNPKNAQGCYNLHGKNSRSNNPEQDKGGPASEPSRGPSGSRQHSTNNKKSVLSKQASGSTKHDNARDDPSEPREDDRQRQSPEETLPGDDNAPDPGHPGDGEDDNAHQGPDQPGEDDSSQQGLDKISERYGRPRVEIFAVRANFHVTDMTISVFDGRRGQIIYMPKDQGEQQPEVIQVEEMNDLVLTGPYRGISAYGNFAIQVDMTSSATGGGKEKASSSSSGDAADGPITWEWDRYNPEHAAQVDAPEPVTHAISLDSWRKINVTYLVMSNAVEAAVKVNLPEMPQDYLPHEKDQGEAEDDGGSKHTAHGTITAHIDGFEKHRIVLFTSAVEVPIPSESLTLPLARPAVQVPQGKQLHIDMADLHITECSSNREVKKPADSDSLSFDFGHVTPTPQFNDDTEEVEVNVTWRPQQNKEKIQVKPHQVCIIGDKEEFSAFIGDLRRVLADQPDREDVLEDYGGTELASTGEHPVLTRPRGKQPKRWIHIELQVVAGQETWSTTLAVRDDKCYGVGFVSQSGVWYDLGNRRGDRALPLEYNSVLLDWGVSYKDILHVSSWDEVVEELDSARPGKDFAQKAVRTLSRYPYVREGDNTRLAVAGLFIMVCESAKFNPLCKHFVDGWDNGTGFPHQLMNYIRNCGHISRALLRWKDLGYDYDTWRHYLGQQPVGISDPENALYVVHLVFNNREAPLNQHRRRQNLQGEVSMNIISYIKVVIEAITGFNECDTFFQRFRSLGSRSNGTESQELKEDDVLKLQNSLQWLQDTLPAMYNFIDRVEWRSHEDSVAELLPKLKAAVYDAEDLLEDFRCYEQKVKIEGSAISMEPGNKLFHDVIQGNFKKLTHIKERLDNQFGLLERMGLYQATPRFDRSVRPETTGFPTESKIFGRDDEIKELIRLLGVSASNRRGPSRLKRKRSAIPSSSSNQVYATLDNNEAIITSVPVLPIVGIGGVGKTTLAQNIYSHPQVKKHFDVKVWICVSDDFDVKRLTKEAIEQFSSKAATKDNLNSLQSDLAHSIIKRRFLIVLDDMWAENGELWKTFYAPFKHVLEGSMMLVTTRSEKVANIVRTMDPFLLDGLKDNVFQSFFKLCVFGSDSSNNNPELERIGEQILPKLKGSPLAAKTLGRLLGMSFDPAHWNMILNSQLWQHKQEDTEIIPALRLSYIYLPFHLKRCFSFCAVYPKVYNFEKEDLAEIWVAEGFVQAEHNTPLQQTGCKYFEELAHLSFFQKLHGKYVMPDLIHDMAQLVSKDDCFIIKEKKDIERIPKDVRHLSVLKSRDFKCSDLENLCKQTKLRSIFCYKSLKGKTGNTMMEKWCTELLCMRVMVCASISKLGLPDSISSMKHLRYLKILDSCQFRHLPEAFCHLYNLQLLSARKCKITVIPRGFSNLINLQKFESEVLNIDASLLNNINLITEELCIYNLCEISKDQTTKIELMEKSICSLTLVWSEGISPEHNEINVFEALHPPTNIKSLNLEHYSGEYLPSWFHGCDNSTIFSALTKIMVKGCPRLSSLEQFLQPTYMPAIKKMVIRDCTSLESVPVERFGDLPALEELEVRNCPKINSGHLQAPSLNKLVLEDSGNLGDDIDCRSLTTFRLSSHHLVSLTLNGDKCPLLTDLTIQDCRELETLNVGWSILKSLYISDCPRLKWENGIVLPSSLQNLRLYNCGYFSVRCPENLTSFEITGDD